MPRRFIHVFCLCLCLGVCAPKRARAADARKPPNILVFIADDVDWKDFGCYGNEAIRTPNVDALARGGLLFRNAFLTTPQCSPTRISVLTGRYAHETGAEDLHMPLPEDGRLVPSYLQPRGYYCGHMRKTHYGPVGEAQFDWYSVDVGEFPGFLDSAQRNPWFLWVGFRDAHRPYESGAIENPHRPQEVQVPPYLADTPETRADLALYYDEISRMDGEIGEMMAELGRRGLRENTLVVFFSDNGRPFPRAKGSLYDSGIGTPLVFSWPGRIEAGSVHEGLASVIDLAPTFLELAGAEVPPVMSGRSLVAILDNPALPGRRYVFAERNWHNCDEHMRSVRTMRYKLIRNAYLDLPFGSPADVSRSPSWKSLKSLLAGGRLTEGQAWTFRSPRPPIELYDIEADPWEMKNLAAEDAHLEAVEDLLGALDEWGRRTHDFPPTLRRRADNTDRVTGIKFSREIAPMTDAD